MFSSQFFEIFFKTMEICCPSFLTILSLIVTLWGWTSTFNKQKKILEIQNNAQKNITELENRLIARREIAREKMGDFSAIQQWVVDGLEVREYILDLQKFLDFVSENGKSTTDPKFNLSEIRERYWTWSGTSKRLILFAQIYNPKDGKNISELKNQDDSELRFDGNLPDDLPSLLELYEILLRDFMNTQMALYSEYQDPQGASLGPSWDELWETVIPNAEQYIIPTYKKIHIILDSVREFVITEKLSSKSKE